MKKGNGYKNPAAVYLGRLGGLIGGSRRAASLSPGRRKQISRNAALVRWGSYKKEITMEITADSIPQETQPEQEQGLEQEQEEAKGWLGIEEKGKLVAELDAFEAGGGLIGDFAASKGMSKWTLLRYRKQVNRHNKGALRKENKQSIASKAKEARALVAGGMTAVDAMEQVGITANAYYYHTGDKKRQQADRIKKQYAPRQVKQMPEVSKDTYNKSLAARCVSLERLVIELSLDKQALMEAREGAI